MILELSKTLRPYVLGAFYLVQGIPMGFVSIGLTGYLAANGVGARGVAILLAVAWLPWALKIGFAPLIDRNQRLSMGRRRPWLLIAQVGMAASASGLLLLSDPVRGLPILMILIVVHNAFGSLQDVSIDAMAVDLLEEKERGRANGIMWSAKIGGMAIGAAGAGTLLSAAGWRPAAMVLLVPSLMAAAAVPFFRERVGDVSLAWGRRSGPVNSQRSRYLIPRVMRAMRSEQAAWLALMALVGSLPARMMVSVAPSFIVQDVGWTESAFAQFAGGPVLIAGAVGALLGGVMSDRWGRGTVLAVGTATVGGLLLVLGAVPASHGIPALLASIVLCVTASDMAVRVSLFALYMKACSPGIAATQYTLYMVLGNLCNVIGSILVAGLSSIATIPLLFMAASLLAVPVLIITRQVRVSS